MPLQAGFIIIKCRFREAKAIKAVKTKYLQNILLIYIYGQFNQHQEALRLDEPPVFPVLYSVRT